MRMRIVSGMGVVGGRRDVLDGVEGVIMSCMSGIGCFVMLV
jgi:hypothetical protein